MRFTLLFIPGLLFFLSSFSQAPRFSESYNELIKQRSMYNYPTKKWDSLRCAWYGECAPVQIQQPTSITSCPLTKRFFGWHAIGTSSASYKWSLLSDLSYFSYDVEPTTGNAKNPSQIAAFPADTTVVTAIANGVRVSLCATLFNNTTEFSTFFGNLTAQNTLITNLINAATNAGARGINIDFEGSGLGSTYLSQFTNFINSLSSQLHSAIPGSELSMDLQGSNSSLVGLTSGLQNYVDLFIMMGYDYYWTGQVYPGPVAPTYQFPKAPSDLNGHGSVSNDLNNLIKNIGINKTILAMPYYGRRWKTTNGCIIPADGNASSPSSPRYYDLRQNVNGYYTNAIRENNSFSAYHCFDVSGIPYQSFFDDTFSLQKKYDLVKQRGISGVAVWRLGYDAGYNDCWNLVNNNLSSCSITPLNDTIFDMGGPTGNYHSNENYYFTIAPPSAGTVALNFLSIDLESGYDYLRLFNGADTTAPLIGFFSGNIIPATVAATSGIMTVKFHSDGALVKAGFKAYYNTCKTLRKTIASGNWNDPATWECGLPPLMNDSVEISSGHSITVPSLTGQIKHLRVNAGGSLTLNDPGIILTVGDASNKTSSVSIEGSLSITNGTMMIYGNLVFGGGYNFALSGGNLKIDGNSGSASTSIPEGQPLFNAPVTAGSFSFPGGLLQFINPPFGAGSETLSSYYDFGPNSTLQFGDGVSVVSSNNTNGFGGLSFPSQIGKLILDAATLSDNRVFKVVKPLTVKVSCEVRTGNLIPEALVTVDN